MRMPTRPKPGRLAAILGLFALAAASRPALAEQSNITAETTIPFVDRGFGYELALPAGWRYDRTAFFGPGGSLGLLRGFGARGQESLQILLFRNVKPCTMQEWTEFFSRQLGGVSGVTGVAVKFQEKTTDAGSRPFGYVLVRARDGADRIETVYYCTHFDESTIWIFAKAGVLPADAAPPPTANAGFDVPADFQTIVKSLRVTYDPAIAEEMRKALERGKEWLAEYKLQEAIRALRLDEETRFYEIRLKDRAIGYLTRKYAREFRTLDDTGGKRGGKKKEGLRVREVSWRFGEDGSAFHSLIDLFSSVDGVSDMYERIDTSIPPPGKTESMVVSTCDQVLRESDVLFSTFRTSLDQTPPDPRPPLKLDPAYLGLTWVRALPALLGKTERTSIGFMIYDSETRALAMQSMLPRGESALPESDQKAYLYETQEGVVESRARLFTDARGHMLRVEAGDLLIRLSDEAAIERLFAEKRASAQKSIPKSK